MGNDVIGSLGVDNLLGCVLSSCVLDNCLSHRSVINFIVIPNISGDVSLAGAKVLCHQSVLSLRNPYTIKTSGHNVATSVQSASVHL